MTERPADAPATNHPLLEASRYNDAEAEDHGLREAIEKHGLDFDAVEYTAKQRALRVVLIQGGRQDEITTTRPSHVTFSDAEMRLMEGLIPLYIDAIFLGWRAKELEAS